MAKKSRKRGSSANPSKPVNVQSAPVNWATKLALVTATLNFGTVLMKMWQDNHTAIAQFFHTLFRLNFASCRRKWMSRHLQELSPAA